MNVVLFYLDLQHFSAGDSDDDMRSVKSASTVASKVNTATPFVFFFFFSSYFVESHFLDVLEVAPLQRKMLGLLSMLTMKRKRELSFVCVSFDVMWTLL